MKTTLLFIMFLIGCTSIQKEIKAEPIKEKVTIKKSVTKNKVFRKAIKEAHFIRRVLKKIKAYVGASKKTKIKARVRIRKVKEIIKPTTYQLIKTDGNRRLTINFSIELEKNKEIYSFDVKTEILDADLEPLSEEFSTFGGSDKERFLKKLTVALKRVI